MSSGPVDAAIGIWSIDGIVVARSNYSYGQDRWLPYEGITSVEPMTGGGLNRDSAGVITGQLDMELLCNNATDQAAILGKVGKFVTLAKTAGGTHSLQVLLMSASAIQQYVGAYGVKVSFR